MKYITQATESIEVPENRIINLSGSNFRGSNLIGSDLRGSDLSGCKYDEKTIWPAGIGKLEQPK